MAEHEHEHGLHAVAISDHVEDLSRRVARTWSLTATVLFVVLGFTVGIPHGPDAEPWERIVQLVTLGILAIGALLALRYEGVGGAILLVGSAGLWGLSALQHQPAISFLPGLLFLVPAVAFLIAWQRTKSTASLLVLLGVVALVLTGGALYANSLYQHGYGAAHPESQLPPLPESPVVWIWSGSITSTDATVVARLAETSSAYLTVMDDQENLHEVEGIRTQDVWRFALDDLTPGTRYDYHVTADGTPLPERTGTFTTFPVGPTSFTVAAASCARLGSNGLVYETIAAREPDVFISTGDLFYADYVQSAAHFTHAYESSLTQPAQAHLFSSIPIAYVWDDHDYGRNDSDATSPTRQLAFEAYTRNVPHYPLAAPDAIYQAFSIGRVQFVLIDDRSQRDPSSEEDGPDKTMLGEDQLLWLQERLLDDRYVATIVVSQVPWISEPVVGADHWGGYTYERQRIAEFIATNDTSAVVMIAGDAHMVAIDDGTNTNYAANGEAAFPLLQAAALDRPGSIKGGPYSEGAFAGAGQFGLIEVTDTGGSTLEIRLSGLDWTADTIVEYEFTVEAP